ncbi:TonB-dependent receptor [Caulobacter segnis]|uniref:TonB-dependent receptor n=1 Tax=Caulobacter segnis TaxID=88688 RepID=UPI00240EE3DA|nr:TonB-dependent receptor [Caulobacter segnis]MDG2520459.1 TonB-dependent receptor [Caulobacter segnis]
MSSLHSCSVVAAATCAILGAGAAHAAEADALEPVIITAERRQASVATTPLAVTAVTGEALIARGAEDVSSLARIIPNLQLEGAAPLSGGAFNATPFIRGIGQNDASIFNEPGVGIYLDGVYLGRSTGAILELLDVERVEVLRGPQGALFGKNAVGGVLNVISRRPSQEPSARFAAVVGDYGRRDVTAVVGGGVAQSLSARLAVGRFERDGYVKRLADGARQGGKGVFTAKGSVLYEPDADLSVQVGLDLTRADQESAALTLLQVAPRGAPFLDVFNAAVAPRTGIRAPDGAAALNASFVTGDPFTTWATGPNRNTLDQGGLAVTAQWRPSDAVTVKSITAYRRLNALFSRDGDNTPFTFRETSDSVQQEQISQELQLSGEVFDGRLEWLTGLYAGREIAAQDSQIVLASGVYDPVLRPNTALELVFRQYNKMNTLSYGAFAHGRLALTDRLSATLGLRYSRDEKRFQVSEQRKVSRTFIVDPRDLELLWGRYPLRGAWDDLSPTLGLQYAVTGDHFAYANASKGFKSGGFNGRATSGPADIARFDPETVWSYEAGIKSRWLDGRLETQLTGFWMEYEDIQVTVNRTPANFVGNAAEARLRGLELEWRAAPWRGLLIEGSVGHNHARYTRVGQGGLTLPITRDSRLVRAPQWTGALAVEQSVATSYGQFHVRGDWSYVDRQHFDAANSPLISQSAYSLFNARLGWRDDDDAWQAAIFVNNLTDETYLVSGNAASPAFGSITEGAYGRPREIGISLERRF